MMSKAGTERIKYITSVALYGTIGIFLRHVSFPTELVAMCRGILGTAFILTFMALRHRKVDREAIRKNLLWLVLSGICLGLNWIFLFAAYVKTTVAVASLCNYMAPLLVIIAAPMVLHEKLNIKKLPCVAVAFIGIVLVSGVIGGETGNTAGVAYGLAAAVAFVCIVLCNRKLKDISAMERSIVQLSVSAVTILPYFIWNNRDSDIAVDTGSVLIVLMLGILHTGVAYCLYFSGLGTLPVQTIAILGYLEPVVSVFCSALILREHMSVWGWLGAGMIIVSAVVSELIPQD